MYFIGFSHITLAEHTAAFKVGEIKKTDQFFSSIIEVRSPSSNFSEIAYVIEKYLTRA